MCVCLCMRASVSVCVYVRAYVRASVCYEGCHKRKYTQTQQPVYFCLCISHLHIIFYL